MSTKREGRSCPIDYRYHPSQIAATEPCLSTQVLYIAGGLYGNPYALDSLESMVANEADAKLIVNGDFHWFDAETEMFRCINTRVAKYYVITGNVEKELSRIDSTNVTRIAASTGHLKPLYSTEYNGLVYEALPLYYDHLAWKEHFLFLWPEGTDAWVSYWKRIKEGGKQSINHLMRV